jgi:hypothetical protein
LGGHVDDFVVYIALQSIRVHERYVINKAGAQQILESHTSEASAAGSGGQYHVFPFALNPVPTHLNASAIDVVTVGYAHSADANARVAGLPRKQGCGGCEKVQHSCNEDDDECTAVVGLNPSVPVVELMVCGPGTGSSQGVKECRSAQTGCYAGCTPMMALCVRQGEAMHAKCKNREGKGH